MDEHATSQADIASEFEDFKVLGNLKKLNRDELFDEQFLVFMRWFKKDVFSRYTMADFQRMERTNFCMLVGGYITVLLSYIFLHTYVPEHPVFWGLPLFVAAVWVMKQAGVIHMRSHAPQNLTGVKLFDKAIDVLGLVTCGVSTNVFKRRHLAAHYNDIGNVSRIFSNAWLTFDQLPASYYLKPYLLVKFLLDKEFCDNEKIDRRLLLIETILFYGYIAATVYETCFLHSYFLLVFHIVPALLISSSQIMGAVIVHSGLDKRNSFDSNGLFDPRQLTGLFRTADWWFRIFNGNFTINHGIHHAYPRLPLEIINKEYAHYHEHILANYDNVRFNQVITHKVHGKILERLPAPRIVDHIVTLGLSIIAHLSVSLTIMGLPLPPNIFEMFLVDYRIFLYSTPQERMANFVRFMESIHLQEKYDQIAEPNTYLRFFYKRYLNYKAQLAALDNVPVVQVS